MADPLKKSEVVLTSPPLRAVRSVEFVRFSPSPEERARQEWRKSRTTRLLDVPEKGLVEVPAGNLTVYSTADLGELPETLDPTDDF